MTLSKSKWRIHETAYMGWVFRRLKALIGLMFVFLIFSYIYWSIMLAPHGTSNKDLPISIPDRPASPNKPPIDFTNVISTSEQWSERLKMLGDEEVSKDLQEKRDFIKQMMKECWETYKNYAFGSNEVNVVQKAGSGRREIYHDINGLTIIDSLDTLLLMNMFEEYETAKEWISQNLEFKSGMSINLFETTIRVFGGLLSAFYLTHEPLFLNKAETLANLTLYAFGSSAPLNRIVLSTKKHRTASGRVCLAEIGTLHLEYASLTHITNNPIYLNKVANIRNRLSTLFYASKQPLDSHFSVPGLNSGGGGYSIGAMSDSFYEYLIKSYIMNQNGVADLKFFQELMPELEKHILKKTKDGFVYMSPSNQMEHLACFSGGMYALASKHVDPHLAEKYLQLGKDLTHTCVTSCFRTATGLCPDNFYVHELSSPTSTDNEGYYLRPEILESVFYLYRITKDPKYQEIGWKLIQSIHKHTRVDTGGYSSVHSVNTIPTPKQGYQESFFLAETLKYGFLLFSDPNFISLDDWVFNTEAHPLWIWSRRDKVK